MVVYGTPSFIAATKFEGQKVGYSFKMGPEGLGYYVEEGDLGMKVKIIYPGGMLDEHNKRNPGAAVELGDPFVSVNGVRGNWDEMLAEFAKPRSFDSAAIHCGVLRRPRALHHVHQAFNH